MGLIIRKKVQYGNKSGTVRFDKAQSLSETQKLQARNNIGVDELLSNKVDKVTGKGLSANDYTDTDKAKLDGIAAGAQVNSVTGVKGDAENSYRQGAVNLTPANIGAIKKGSFTYTLLYQGTPAVNATFTLSDYIDNYNILRIVDTHHYYCDAYMPVCTSAQTIMANGSTSFLYNEIPQFLLLEFTAISSDGINYTVARKAQMSITSTGVEYMTTNADFGIEIYGLK